MSVLAIAGVEQAVKAVCGIYMNTERTVKRSNAAAMDTGVTVVGEPERAVVYTRHNRMALGGVAKGVGLLQRLFMHSSYPSGHCEHTSPPVE